MDRTAIAFFVLCFVLLIVQLVRTETFVDASDNSGNMVTLSLSDLLSLVGGSGMAAPPPPPAPVVIQSPNAGLNAQFYSGLKDDILSDVKNSVRQELLNNPLAASAGSVGSSSSCMDDGCIDSIANSQGNDWMRYVPGKNPNDYIRKDSIPCYGCNLAS